jgi:glycerophosphoryl diester phosphodiesterase
VVKILAHRANIHGPSPSTENRPAATLAALERGWGLETDIRRAPDGRFYISHDPRTDIDEVRAETFGAILRAYPTAPIALNVKELGYEAELLRFLGAEDLLERLFLFDMELLEGKPAGRTARLLRSLHRSVPLAARVSDRGESIEQALSIDVADVIWLDEFDGPWVRETDVRRIKDAGRTIWAVSPDLHGNSRETARKRWIQFCNWGVDGICTDYPDALERLISPEKRSAER